MEAYPPLVDKKGSYTAQFEHVSFTPCPSTRFTTNSVPLFADYPSPTYRKGGRQPRRRLLSRPSELLTLHACDGVRGGKGAVLIYRGRNRARREVLGPRGDEPGCGLSEGDGHLLEMYQGSESEQRVLRFPRNNGTRAIAGHAKGPWTSRIQKNINGSAGAVTIPS